MISPAYFVSEPVQHQGGVVADVMSAAIATSTYSQAQTFLRETLQNACDQKLDEKTPIDFIVDVFQVNGKRKQLFDDFFSSARLGLDPLKLGKLKDAPSFEAMVVADKGTVGLIGPLDASIDEKPSNFAGFFFNVGRQSSEEKSGGSFGLGRTVLTNASEFSTILVYSQFLQGGKIGKRFMGMAIRGTFSFEKRRFTGRHWFGLKPTSGSGIIKPYEDSQAEDLAANFGLKAYLGESTGFVAMVIGNSLITNPENSNLAKQQRADAIEAIQQAACIYGWPHMLGNKKNRSVNFRFILDGKEIEEKDPARMPGIQEFVACYEALKAPVEGVETREIHFTNLGNRKEPTGNLAWINVPSSQSDRELAKNQLIPISSIALMRQANFVVKYLEVTQKTDQISTRGVFKTNNNFDPIFRKSEPVAHDDWIPTKLQLKPNQRNPIKQTLENIKEIFKELSGHTEAIQDGSASVVLGNVVGRLLDGLSLTGPKKLKPVEGGLGGGGSSKGIQIIPIGSPRILDSTLERYSAVFKFQILCSKNSDPVNIQFSAYAILENGNPELDPPIGASIPEIVGINLDNKNLVPSSLIMINNELHMKIVEITVTSAQGIGATCRWKLVS